MLESTDQGSAISARGPAWPLTHHHRGPIRLGGVGAAGDQRGVGGEVTHTDRQIGIGVGWYLAGR
jgi:hypothetical protein